MRSPRSSAAEVTRMPPAAARKAISRRCRPSSSRRSLGQLTIDEGRLTDLMNLPSIAQSSFVNRQFHRKDLLVDGVLVVDKPQGLTSHDVVAVARRCLKESRIGHTGTLDPLATGVLPLACGRATRLVRFLSASEKCYEATILFGIATDSYDVTGKETARTDREPSRDAVLTALESLSGEYLQMPPAYSAK